MSAAPGPSHCLRPPPVPGCLLRGPLRTEFGVGVGGAGSGTPSAASPRAVKAAGEGWGVLRAGLGATQPAAPGMRSGGMPVINAPGSGPPVLQGRLLTAAGTGTRGLGRAGLGWAARSCSGCLSASGEAPGLLVQP